MTTRRLSRALLVKEAHALAAIWMSAAAGILVSTAAGWPTAGLLAFGIGCAALGALSLGHEYDHRTLPMLLAQPVPRSRLLAPKVIVLAVLLAALALLAALVLFPTRSMAWMFGGVEHVARWQPLILVLTPVLAFCLAPYLTMRTRSAVAGAIATVAVPAALWTGAQLARVLLSGFDVRPLEYEPLRPLMIGGVLAISSAAAIAGWRRFAHLEALGETGSAAHGVARGSSKAAEPATASRRRHPVRSLVGKELRLYPLALIVAGLYALAWMGTSLAGGREFIAGQSFDSIAELYAVFVTILIGALASAEERALGTHSLQLSQPYALWKQWLLKLATAYVLVLLLGPGLANALESSFPLVADHGRGPVAFDRLWLRGAVGLHATVFFALLLASSLHASSLCASGLRALLLALPLIAVFGQTFMMTTWGVSQSVARLLTSMTPGATGDTTVFWMMKLTTWSRADSQWWGLAERWIPRAVLAGFLVTLIVLAYRNDRLEPSRASAIRQCAWLAVFVVAGAIVIAAVPQTFGWFLITR